MQAPARGRITVRTWHLEMREAPRSARPLPAGASLVAARAIPLSFYRYLYETVGAPWCWVDRRWMGDAELGSLVHDPRVEVHVAYADGAPVGYFELDARALADARAIELAYFGLVPWRIGTGLGAALLTAAVTRAWELGRAAQMSRLWVHTCSLDHPRAKDAYERAGFVAYEVHDHEEWDPRPLPVSVR
jgi:GNAT superfamily N-acetyltransferase